MRPTLFLLVLLVIADVGFSFAIIIRERVPVPVTKDVNNNTKRQQVQVSSSQIIFETEPALTVKTTTTKRPITSPASHVKVIPLEVPTTNATGQRNITIAVIALKNTTNSTLFNNVTIPEVSAANRSNVATANACEPEITQNTTTLTYITDDYIKSKLCSNINSTLSREYRFDLDAKVCSQVARQSHCGKNMVFYSYTGNNVYGQCDCDYSSSIPLVYHQQTNRCYFMYQQGFCQKEEWLEMARENGTAVCTTNKCYDHGRRGFGSPPLAARDMAPEYVPLEGDGPCVKLNHHYVEHCAEKKDIVTFNWPQKFYPTCGQPIKRTPLLPEGPSGRFLGDVASLQCNPGSYFSAMGICQPSWEA